MSLNKRGDIPVIILVIGVFAICTLAILSFKFVSIKSEKGFTETIQTMEEINAEIQKYYFYQNAYIIGSELKELLGVKNNYIEIEREVDGEKIISIKYVLPG